MSSTDADSDAATAAPTPDEMSTPRRRAGEEPTPAVPDAAAVSPGVGGAPAGGPGAGDRRAAANRRALDRRVMAVVEGMSDAFIAVDAGWRVTYANREAARLNGTSPAALVGGDHWALWPETLGSAVERHYRRAARERVPVAFEHHYPGADVWHEVRAYPADDGGLAIFYRDISAQKALEAERQRQARDLAAAHDKAFAAEMQFRLLVDRVRDYAVFLLDPDGIVTHWGDGAERIKQWKPEEIVGQHLRVLYPAEEPPEDGTAEDHLRHAAAHGEYIGEGRRRRKNGELFQARVVLTALRRDGELVGFSKIAQDLTGEREHHLALEAAMRAAQAASVAKSQFLANTSHEIRTPLNAIMGYAELLEMGLAGALSPQQRQYVSRIQRTSGHLLALINDVLDLSRIEAGHVNAVGSRARCTRWCPALLLVEPQVRARRIALATPAGTRRRTAATRAGAQILANLLSNAVRFTEPGGRVTVTCGTLDHPAPDASLSHAGPVTFIKVEDTGVGILPDQLDRIWEAFVQVDASRTRVIGGSGLGLTISRHLARLMGGDITVRSEPGLGSAFVVWLPAAEPREVTEARESGYARSAPRTTTRCTRCPSRCSTRPTRRRRRSSATSRTACSARSSGSWRRTSRGSGTTRRCRAPPTSGTPSSRTTRRPSSPTSRRRWAWWA
jgi:PAS domain S-box-containing protein